MNQRKSPFTFSLLTRERELGQLSGIALDYGLEDREFESRQGLGIFIFTTPRPNWLWGTSSLLSNGYQWLFP
jgi:hypothetical protein